MSEAEAVAFRDAAFNYLNATDNSGACSNRSCLRCRIADVAFEVEKKHKLPPQELPVAVRATGAEADYAALLQEVNK